MEACPGSQWLARKLQKMGHTGRIVPAQFVKPFVKSNKNDIIDAEVIAEAVTRPTMRFVEIRTPEQIDLQALHRVRDRMIAHRTRLISQMRAFCLEYGIAIHQGAGKFKADLPRVLADESNELTPVMRRMLTEVFGEARKQAKVVLGGVVVGEDPADERRLEPVIASPLTPFVVIAILPLYAPLKKGVS